MDGFLPTFPLVIAGVLLILFSFTGVMLWILSTQLRQLRLEKANLEEELRFAQGLSATHDEAYRKLQSSREESRADQHRQREKLQETQEALVRVKTQSEQRLQRVVQSNERLQRYNSELEQRVTELSAQVRELNQTKDQLLHSVRQLQVIKDQLTQEKETLLTQSASEVMIERLRICAALSESIQRLENEVEPMLRAQRDVA